jgi:predicted nuclease of predicted toxin-antitoxin system
MRLLLDENVAPRLVERLRDIFDIVHVRDAGLAAASDVQVWEFARESGRTIVTKDADFEEFAVLRGAPPKVVWLRLGNASTSDVERALRRHAEALREFEENREAAVFAIVR